MSESFGGVAAAGHSVRASIVGRGGRSKDSIFALSSDGLSGLADWLRQEEVRKLALLQGALAFPWQRADWPARRKSGPIDLAYWLEVEGADALATVDKEAAWQPILLALREEFDLFVIKPAAIGGPYEVESGTRAARDLAVRLAAGAFAELYPKSALERVIELLSDCAPDALAEAISFFSLETRGYWHNRARAKIARRLKHCPLDEPRSRQLADCIARRLVEGRFTEQFRDQLTLLLHLDRDVAVAASAEALKSPRAHVQRLGFWLKERASAGDYADG